MSREPPAFEETPQLRAMRRLVMIMTALLCGGLVVLIGRVIYLAARPLAQASLPGTTPPDLLALRPDIRLALPADATVSALALAGSRLAVAYRAPAGDGLTILDLASGEVLTRVSVGRDGPR